MKTLIQHLRDNNLSLREFARRADISPSFLSEITTDDPLKRKNPSLAMALKIQVWTKGAVAVSDWPKLAEVANAIHGEQRGACVSALQGSENTQEGAA